MQTLARAVQTPGATGRKLTLPWVHMNELVTLRTGELVTIAGAPGGGKSTVAVNLAMQVTFPVLYLAQDSPHSVVGRMAALGSGVTTRDAARTISQDHERDELGEKLATTRPTLVINRGAVTLDQIEHMIHALREWLGEAPPLVILDNLIDTIVPGTTHGDMGFYTTALPTLKQMAIKHQFACIALHHVTRGGGKETSHARGTKGMSMNDLLFAGERESRHVWGVYHSKSSDEMYVQILKQQDGRADPDGGLEVGLRWYPALGRLASMA